MTTETGQPDPFGTAAVRERVLRSWAAAPVRFREDANAEEELALGAYRHRVLVELAQNAADAAARAGVPGRLLLRWSGTRSAGRQSGGTLLAANTGVPLDAVGVEALATLRASAKRGEDSVGHFGVGFSAVLGVTDTPAVISATGGVRFSAADSRSLVEQAAASSPGLAAELAARDGHVPALRLPFPAAGEVPEGYHTAVLLPARDGAAAELIDRLLEEVGDPLLLALPALAEIVVETDAGRRRHAEVGSRWHVHRRSGRFGDAQLADRPSEERRRTGWQLTWALPRQAAPAALGVLHAPTPSEERLNWPALLVASFPMDSGRRHVESGPATDALVRQAAAGYAELLAERARAGQEIWPLVPTGLPGGPLDAALREAAADVLPRTPLLHPADPKSADPKYDDPTYDPGPLDPEPDFDLPAEDLLRPRDAVVLEPPAGTDPEVVAAFARFVHGLVVAPRSGRAVLEALGVTRLGLADAVDALPAGGEPSRWAQLYAAVDGLTSDPSAREALAGLPVPLTDGRTVRGARGSVLAADGLAEPLSVLGVRIVDATAAHPVLERLGAQQVDARQALDLPAVRAAVSRSAESQEPEREAGAVLALIAAALQDGPLDPAERPWLGELELPDADGEPVPGYALALSGSPAADWFDPDEIGLVDPELERRWGPQVLAAAGVLTGLALLRAAEIRLAEPDPDDPDDDPDDPASPATLPGWQDWVDDVLALTERAGGGEVDAWLPELAAVRDLDLVRQDAWPAVLAAIDADPDLRRAVVEPARVVVAGRQVVVPSYSAWWLRHRLAGGAGAVAAADGDPVLVAALPAEPAAWQRLSAPLRRALGVIPDLRSLDAAALPAVLARLGDPAAGLDAAGLLALWRRLARLAQDGAQAEPPDQVRVPDGEGSTVLAAEQVIVVDSPMHLQRHDLGAALPVPSGLGVAVADLLDVRFAQDAPGVVEESGPAAGVQVAMPAVVGHLLPAAPHRWCEHEQLLVDTHEVDWWVGDDGLVHAATLDGLARAVAWSCAAWPSRLVLSQALIEPGTVADLLLDEAVSPLS